MEGLLRSGPNQTQKRPKDTKWTTNKSRYTVKMLIKFIFYTVKMLINLFYIVKRLVKLILHFKNNLFYTVNILIKILVR